MGLLDFIGSIFKPVTDTIDEIHVSDEERGKLRNKLAKIQADVQTKLIDLEGKRLEALSKVQVAEASSKHLITSIWRPISSLMFVIVITLGAFHIIQKPDKEFYDLATLFLGVYGGGRSLEKLGEVVKGLGK